MCVLITFPLEAAMRAHASGTSCLLQRFHQCYGWHFLHSPSLMNTQRNCLFYTMQDCRVSYRSPRSLPIFIGIYFIFLFFPDFRIICGNQDTAVATPSRFPVLQVCPSPDRDAKVCPFESRQPVLDLGMELSG